MIHAGTISTGSGCIVGVVGAYWISSISRLRSTTRPGVTATSPPTSKRLGAGRRQVEQLAPGVFERDAPRRAPGWRRALRSVRRSTTGLASTEFDGATMSSHWRAAKLDHLLRGGASRRARRWSRAATTAGAAGSACASQANGALPPLRVGEALVLRQRLDDAMVVGVVGRRRAQAAQPTARPRNAPAPTAWPATRARCTHQSHERAERGGRRDAGRADGQQRAERSARAPGSAGTSSDGGAPRPSQGLPPRSREPATAAGLAVTRCCIGDQSMSRIVNALALPGTTIVVASSTAARGQTL